MTEWALGPALAAFHAGVTVVCELAAQFTDDSWAAPTPCPEWRAGDLAGHLRCMADNFNEYLDDAPASRLARLMATGADAAWLARKLARQNAAELAALAEGQGPEHITAFAASARLMHGASRRSGTCPTTATGTRGDCRRHGRGGLRGMNLHAWDLARALGKDDPPADPDIVAAVAGRDAPPPTRRPGGRGHLRRRARRGQRRAGAGGKRRLAGRAGRGSRHRRVAGAAARLRPPRLGFLWWARPPRDARRMDRRAIIAVSRAAGRGSSSGALGGAAVMTLDVAAIRAAYPALADGYAYLDGAAGTQVPAPVIDAISAAHRSGLGNAGGVFPASKRADTVTAQCRQAVADLTGGSPDGVILGPNMTTLTYRLAGTLARAWGPGDEVVVSRLDHDANVRPWVQAAARAGAVVRWAEVELPAGELPAGQYDSLLSERTVLVAVTAASNVLGTRPAVAEITARARAVGALSYVDGVHATPHGPTDVAALGADFYATSAYKWSGPHVGAVVADPALLETLRPDKLEPSPDTVPERFEQGTPPFADLAGVAAAVDHLASLEPSAAGTRRERVLASMAAAHDHEQALFQVLLDGLGAMPKVTLYGKAPRRTATAYFTVAGTTPAEVAAHLAGRKVNVWNGHNYAWELTGVLGIRDAGSAVRAGLVHYNDRSDVDRLLAAVAELAG